MNAFNLWYVLSPHHNVLPWPKERIADSQAVIGNITFKQIGLFLASIFVLLICVVAWNRFDQDREFVWAAALYFGVFMLPTQVHERYLFPALIFLIIALAQDIRLWPILAGTMYTFAYNVTWVAPVNMSFLWASDFATAVAVLNVLLLAWLIYLLTIRRRPAASG
jgi:hypothetical protein